MCHVFYCLSVCLLSFLARRCQFIFDLWVWLSVWYLSSLFCKKENLPRAVVSLRFRISYQSHVVRLFICRVWGLLTDCSFSVFLFFCFRVSILIYTKSQWLYLFYLYRSKFFQILLFQCHCDSYQWLLTMSCKRIKILDDVSIWNVTKVLLIRKLPWIHLFPWVQYSWINENLHIRGYLISCFCLISIGFMDSMIWNSIYGLFC